MDLSSTRDLYRAGSGPARPAARVAEPVPGPRRGATAAPGPLRLHQLPMLLLTGPAVEERRVWGPRLERVEGLEPHTVEHVVAGSAHRRQRVTGVRLALSDAGLDRAAGLVALGADHARGCLGADGLFLGDATRYAARLERLGLRAESAWPGLAEGHYVLDADAWNLRRLVAEHVLQAAEALLGSLPVRGSASRAARLALLGPTCATTA